MDSELLKKLSKEIHDLKSEVMELRRRPLPIGAWSSWTPSWSAAGSMTISSVSLNVARYYTMGKTFTYFVDARFTLGGTANNAVILTLPSGISPKYFAACGGWIINGGGLEAAAAYVRDTGVAEARPATGLNWTLGIDKRLSIFGTVELT